MEKKMKKSEKIENIRFKDKYISNYTKYKWTKYTS